MLVARRVSIWWSEDYAIFQGDLECARLRPDAGSRFLIEVGDAQYEGTSPVPREFLDPHGKLAFTLINQSRLQVAAAYATRPRWWQTRYNVPLQRKGARHSVHLRWLFRFVVRFLYRRR